VAAVFRTWRHLLMLALAALLIGTNWLVFLWAVANQQVVASSLGYFLTPLVSVLLGLLVLKERLNRLEWLSVALALAAIANDDHRLGSLPWVSLILAGTFGTYGLVRKKLAGRLDLRPVAGNPGHAAGVRPLRLVAGTERPCRYSPATTCEPAPCCWLARVRSRRCRCSPSPPPRSASTWRPSAC
jgi:hypothetical protein